MDWVQLLPTLAILCVALFFFLKRVAVPAVVQYVVREMPLDKEVAFEAVHLKSITDQGLQLSLAFRVVGSKPPFNVGTIVVRIVSPLRVFDAMLNDLWAEVLIQQPIVAGGPFGSEPRDMRVALDHVEVVLAESMESLKQVARRVTIGGQREVDRITVRLEFAATIDIMGLMVVEAVPLAKTINLGELQAIKAAAIEKRRAAREAAETAAAAEAAAEAEQDGSDSGSDLPAREDATQTTDDDSNSTAAASAGDVDLATSPSAASLEFTSFIKRGENGLPTLNKEVLNEVVGEVAKEALAETGIEALIPIPMINRLPVRPHMRSIVGGLDIQFATPPNLNFKLSSVRFDVILNGGKVAHGTLRGLEMSNTKTEMHISLEVVPAMVSEAPIRGFASTAKGMLTGAVKGALNGLLYGDWGAGSTIVGISGLAVENEEGRIVPWLAELLSAIEIEHDVDAVRKFGSTAVQATSSLKDNVMQMAAGVLEVAGPGGARCSVM
ncbi:hypothetical protein HK105_208764 [Polyrhizophydium stewartii]|uniref:Uncharacterized protein n=1 Tax=Polyrhizophydium stewartii TaxID=2732419 RepID=A0ABR4MX19_9FUNG|nr:hypothetical protein HK105_001445 [Polyrhizophydium stewartii]